MRELIASKRKGRMTEKFAHMLLTLSERYASRGNFSSYSYRQDMVAHSMMALCRTWMAFDETRWNNPFAFYTQCIKNSFYQQLNNEKKERDLRDDLLQMQGFNPSYTRQMDGDDSDSTYENDDWDMHVSTDGAPVAAVERDAALDSLDEPRVAKPRGRPRTKVKIKGKGNRTKKGDPKPEPTMPSYLDRDPDQEY